MTSSSIFDVVVVGAGAIGLSIADALAERGSTVLVLDAGEPAREASWAAGGILSPVNPYRYPEPLIALAARSLELWEGVARSLEERTGVSIELRRTGLVRIVLDDDDAATVDRARAWRRAHALESRELDAASLREAVPLANPAARAALHESELAQIRPPRFLRALLASLARRPGVEVRGYDPVIDLVRRGDRVHGVRALSGSYSAREVVLAAGAWSGELARRAAGIELRVEPVRGQMLLLENAPPLGPMVLGAGGRYLIPRADGRVLVGSTLERVGFDKSVTAGATRDLLDAALKMAPALARARLATSWSGLRPGSPDGLPHIGRAGAGLVIATGHYRNGILLAPVTAEAVADIVGGKDARVDLRPFAPERTPAEFRAD